MEKFSGLIFNVKRYSVNDGPGIRVTFFMKGCPLSCRWCHNPEGISPLQESVETTRRVGEMMFQTTEQVGRYYSVDEVVEMVEKDKIFLEQSGGGVTFSGGEPMLQPEFLFEALRACRENGYHTAVDTSGCSSPENYRKIMPYTDLFLFDIKHLDDSKHKENTGVSNILILDNFKRILNSGKDVMVRIPVIPGVNDDIEYIGWLKKFLIEAKCDNIKMINLLPYHKIGLSKYRKFNIPYRMEDIEQPSSKKMNELEKFFSDVGIKIKIGG